MLNGFFITGTDTEIGKTHAAVKLIHRWRLQGKRVAAMKPVACGCDILSNGQWRNDDVEHLIAATGQADRDMMNPYRFLPAVSPHIAAHEQGISISLPRICEHYRQLSSGYDIVVVEGVGGWLSPLSDELTVQDMAQALGLPVILVVGMRLGCLNHALLTYQAILNAGVTLAGWVANCAITPQLSYQRNLDTLIARIPAPMLLELPFEGGLQQG